MTTTEQTCEQRIDAAFEERADDFRFLDAMANDDFYEGDHERMVRLGIDPEADQTEQAVERIMEYPLAVEVVRVVKVTLGTGGPGDWLEATLDDDGDITRIEYHFNDWFDHASRTLSGDDFDVAETFIRACAYWE